MAVERAPAGSSLIDVLDRVLDKGIVIDAYVRVSLVGIDLVSVEARIVVASVETYLRFADAIAATSSASRPMLSGTGYTAGGYAPQREMDRVMAENAELKRRLDELS
ncbi:MAG TPA: gas vesicle structural protein GvpA [Longimicrobiales bacterium]|nr:gas vesicle structural protein GvpA [Longimicrobiales bacterium]